MAARRRAPWRVRYGAAWEGEDALGSGAVSGDVGEAERLESRALEGIDFRLPDRRVVFAVEAKSSSEYSTSYAARSAVGPPKVFPEGGDEYGTWLADNSDEDPWIELRFPPTRAVALLVFETCGPGAVYEAIDLEQNEPIYRGEARRFSDTREARLLHVKLDGRRTLSKLRLRVKPRAFGGDEWKEIDAVAILTEPLSALRETPPRFETGGEKRYRPEEAAHFPIRSPDTRVHWATKARASSRYSSSYSAKEATGRPRVYPKAGDRDQTWCPGSDAHNEWLELDFPEHEVARALAVFETNVAGSVVRVTAPDDTVLWQGLADHSAGDEARLLYIPFQNDDPKRRLRLWLSGELRGYRQIDAVAILTVPWGELHGPPPPPPKKYPPGTPAGGWTRLEGTLLGDVVQASLHGPHGSAHENGGSPVLRLDDGDEVSLTLGRTTLYGAPLERQRGEPHVLGEGAPHLFAPFSGEMPPGEHILEGRRITDSTRVVVLGEVTGSHTEGGFRDRARETPTSMHASAIAKADAPRLDALLDAHAPAHFERKRPTSKPEAVRHPLTPYAIGCAIIAAIVAGAGISAQAPFALVAACLPAILALDFVARIWAVPPFTHANSGLSDRAVLVKTPWAVVMLNGFFVVMASLAFVFVALMAVGFENEGNATTLGFGFTAVAFALLRLGSFWRIQARPMKRALRALMVGQASRFSGVLGPGTFTRREKCLGHSKHVGSYRTTDDQGNLVTRNQYESWYERHVDVSGPGDVIVIVPDGTVAHAPAARTETTDATLYPLRTENATETLHLWGRHEEGDPATLVGTAHLEGKTHVLDAPRLLVLGPMSALWKRVAAIFLATAGLLALVLFAALAMARALAA